MQYHTINKINKHLNPPLHKILLVRNMIQTNNTNIIFLCKMRSQHTIASASHTTAQDSCVPCVQGAARVNPQVPSSKSSLVGGCNPSEKYESQWEGLSHILWKIKIVRNHQPVYIYIYMWPICTTVPLGPPGPPVCRLVLAPTVVFPSVLVEKSIVV